jgi:hypothetical protein
VACLRLGRRRRYPQTRDSWLRGGTRVGFVNSVRAFCREIVGGQPSGLSPGAAPERSAARKEPEGRGAVGPFVALIALLPAGIVDGT